MGTWKPLISINEDFFSPLKKLDIVPVTGEWMLAQGRKNEAKARSAHKNTAITAAFLICTSFVILAYW